MKTILRGIFAVFAAVGFSAVFFAAENASADGAYLRAIVNSGDFFVSANYESDSIARNAAMQACQNAGNTGCDNTQYDIVSFKDSVFAFISADLFGVSIQQYFGTAANENLAVDAMVNSCLRRTVNNAMCQNLRTMSYRICGDGSAFVSPNNCDAVAPTCTGEQTLNIEMNICECVAPNLDISRDCQTPTSCTAPETLNTGTNICECVAPNLDISGNCQAPTSCTAPAILNMDTNNCDCNSPNLDIGGNCQTRNDCSGRGDRTLNEATNTCDLTCTGGDLPIGDNCETRMDCDDGQILNTANNTCAAPSVSEKDTEKYIYLYGGGVVIAAAAWYLSGDAVLADVFTFSPNAGFSATESGYAFNAGGRLDFRQDAWHLYWKTGGVNNNGNFGKLQYGTGGSYTGDFWTAAFSETVRGEKADYNFSLAMDYRNGLWNISPVYRLHTRYEEGETETENALNLEAAYKRNRWILRPSASFGWETPEDFGDNVRFGIHAIRQF